MAELIIRDYELSLWERKNINDEKFQLILGSNSITMPYKATNVTLKRKVNGEKILTFTLYTRYFDSEIGDFKDNPLIEYLHNECLLKLRRKNKWQEFIIKDIKESSDAKSFVYTAKSAEAIELGKTGYGLTFNSELMNNTGTAIEIAEKIFTGTDWKVDVENSDKFWGATVEPLFKAILNLEDPSQLTCIREADVGSVNLYFNKVNDTVTFPSKGAVIYIPYSNWNTISETNKLQFLWNKDNIYETDDKGVIYTANSYIWESKFDKSKIQITTSGIVEDKKGDYLQTRNKGYYLSSINKYVTEGIVKNKDDNTTKEAYSFQEAEYLTNSTVSELIVNNKNFEGLSGWEVSRVGMSLKLNYQNFSLEELLNAKTFDSTLVIKSGKEKGYLYNAAIRSNASLFKKGIAVGDKYKFKIKAKTSQEISTKIIIGKPSQKTSSSGEIYKDFSNESIILAESEEIVLSASTKPIEIAKTITFKKGISHADLVDDLYGLYLLVPSNSQFEIIEMSFYKFINDSIYPGSLPEADTIIQNRVILKDDFSDNIKSIDEVQFYTLSDKESFIPNKYGSKYDKISSIEVSKSNRFNALQTLCEAFECWADLIIEHDDNGKIRRDDNGKPQKKVVLKNFIGENKKIGFSYGLNLKKVSRQLVSDQMVTKLIVEQNNNEFGESGFCTIVRAQDNKNKTNFIYNFDYYINQGVLNKQIVDLDLYGNDGLMAIVGNKNQELLSIVNQLNECNASSVTLQAERDAAKEIRDAAFEEIKKLERDLVEYTGASYQSIDISSLTEEQQASDKIKQIVYSIKQQNKLYEQYNKNFITLDQKLNTLKSKITEETKKQKKALSDVENSINDFENKYSSFIQEGTWTDESYVDDNLYYYDAKVISHTSAFPKVNYTFEVIDLYPLGKEYEVFDFNVGDKTYVEDTEFFGWNRSGTSPYREEVVISEIEEFLDAPEKNKITVQNYKTQFEDLFQRIAATTQSLQYAAGAYQRAANKITSTNEIDATTLQNTLLNSMFNLQNMGNLSVSWTSKGLIISSSDSSSSNKKIKLSNTGLELSNDGGLTWRTAITGNGILADEVSAGSIDANKVAIKSGEALTFLWDAKGLRAYDTTWNGDEATVNYNNYILFNDKGLVAHKEDGTTSFSLTSSGDLSLTGTITAENGYIGGWKIESNRLVAINSSAGMESNNTSPYLPAFWAGKMQEENVAEGTINSILEQHQQYYDIVDAYLTEYNKLSDEEKSRETAIEEQLIINYEIYQKYLNDIIKTYELASNIDYFVIKSQNSIWKNNQFYVLYKFTEAGKTKMRTKEKYHANFFVTHGGSLYAKNATIEGHIDAFSGTLKNLIINGAITVNEDGGIFSSNYDPSASGWCITDELAEFNAITVRGSLKVAVFEYGEVSAVGGIILVRPSTQIKNVVGTVINEESSNEKTVTTLIVEDSSQFKEGDWCIIASSVDDVVNTNGTLDYSTVIAGGKIQSKIITDGKHRIIFTENLNLTRNVINHCLINIGKEDADGALTDNVYITINSSNNNAFAVPKSITIGKTTGISNKDGNGNCIWERENKVILGEFPSGLDDNPILKYVQTSYGLWAENAVINGILASYGNKTSAGIWSNSNLLLTKGTWEDKGNIVFWAGAKPTPQETDFKATIEEAPFQVDDRGHLYAQDAYISGFIYADGGKIGNSTIEAIEQSIYSIDIISSNGTSFSSEGQTETELRCVVYKSGVKQEIKEVKDNNTNTSQYFIGQDEEEVEIIFTWKDQLDVVLSKSPTYKVNLEAASNEITQRRFACEVTIG